MTKPEFAVRLLTALEFAAQMHRDQRRKGVDEAPYINHPIQVAKVLASVGGVDDESTLLAAILHDTIEDTEANCSDLTDRFGEDVCALVIAVSDDKTLPKSERKRLQVEHSHQLPDKAKLIKIADKICNVRDIGSKPPVNWSTERRREYFDWAEQVVNACAGVNSCLEDCFASSVSEARSKLSSISSKGSDVFSDEELEKFHLRTPAITQAFIDSINKSVEMEEAKAAGAIKED